MTSSDPTGPYSPGPVDPPPSSGQVPSSPPHSYLPTEPGFVVPPTAPPPVAAPYPTLARNAPTPYYQPYPNPGSWEMAQYAPRPGIPGMAVAGTILGFVEGVFLLVVGFFLVLGAGFVDAMTRDSTDTGSGALWLLLPGLGNWVAAVLMIVGGVLLLLRRPAGRVMLVAGPAVVAALAVFWIAIFPDEFVVVWAIVIAAVGIAAAVMGSVGGVSAWLAAPRTPVGPPPFPRDEYGRPFGS